MVCNAIWTICRECVVRRIAEQQPCPLFRAVFGLCPQQRLNLRYVLDFHLLLEGHVDLCIAVGGEDADRPFAQAGIVVVDVGEDGIDVGDGAGVFG
jgi:hypothetical protein